MINNLKVKVFADGADLKSIIKMSNDPFIQGFTTNPTLMRKDGVTDYKNFAKNILSFIQDKPVSFEVLSDNLEEIKIQAETISNWGENVYVKIPIMNSLGHSTLDVIKYLSSKRMKINVTAVFTIDQICKSVIALDKDVPSFISVFAGRIADTGRDPIPVMKKALECIRVNSNIQLIWASPREVFNIVQANQVGCHIITASPELINKLNLLGKDLDEYSLDTVKMFRTDSIKSEFTI